MNFNFLVENPIISISLGFILGSIIGSFFNVCATRIPSGISIISPPSSCPSCNNKILWFQNIPIVSWLLLNGKASCCDYKIPRRYFFMELGSGVIFAYLFYKFSFDGDLQILFLSMTFASIMIIVSVIDLETMLIPDRFSIGGSFVGLSLSLFFPVLHGFSLNPLQSEMIAGLWTSFLGLIISSSLLFWVGSIAETFLKKEALGQGDIKLLGCIGAFCGWQGGVFSIFGGAILGTVLMIPVLVAQKIRCGKDQQENEKFGWGVEIPFGPFLAMAALLYFIVFKERVDVWFEQVEGNFVYLFPQL
ncbi:MAG TPA: prepilin peptidase [Opitutae bacterium]|nr:prepilin peptidase [Opitutae bacterium]